MQNTIIHSANGVEYIENKRKMGPVIVLGMIFFAILWGFISYGRLNMKDLNSQLGKLEKELTDIESRIIMVDKEISQSTSKLDLIQYAQGSLKYSEAKLAGTIKLYDEGPGQEAYAVLTNTTDSSLASNLPK